jgi:copper homeostasis protein
MSFKLEICSFNLQSALIAQHEGAHRVELCADPAGGGTTPSLGSIKTAREKLHIQLYPIIRPRGGDFLFNEEEFEIMLNDVSLCKQLGCDGVVIGMLNASGTVDKKRCAKLVELAYPLGVTFHRAFDWSANPFEALEDIINIGCERILTSGQKPTAIEGAKLLNEMIRHADNRITIMPGSGVRANNIIELKEKTGAEEFHTSARTFAKSQMQFVNESMKEDNSLAIANENEIKEIIHLLSDQKI